MQLKSRIIAVPLAAVLASGAFFSSVPAQAAPKSKTYKAGAIALGALGAYLLSKGKNVEGAAALGGGYLAYRKGESERKDEKYDNRYGNNRNNNGRYDNNGYYGNGNYNNGNYGNTYYNSNADYRYNNSGSNWNNKRDNDRQCRDNNDRRGNGRSWNR